jgi:nucleotide-binding universal stress UspA family protein
MFEHILFPTDGSDGASAAMGTVQNLAETYGATVHVLNVVDTTHEGLGSDPHREQSPGMVGDPEGGGEGMVGDRTTEGEIHEQVQDVGNRVVEEAAEQFDVDHTVPVVEAGVPHEVILEYVEENDVDVIVMGTHGRTGLDRYLIGSVTEKVVRLAEVPVISVSRDS